MRDDARQIIQQAIEAELAMLLDRYENGKPLAGRRAVVHSGYLPEREVVTAAGPSAGKVPKVRDRSGTGVKFNSAIVPPMYASRRACRRRSPGCTSRCRPAT